MTLVRVAGNTHPGLLRGSNEDRFHYDPARGIFIVIDGDRRSSSYESTMSTLPVKCITTARSQEMTL